MLLDIQSLLSEKSGQHNLIINGRHNRFFHMLTRRIVYCLCVIFFTWLALATRSHHAWFHPVIVEYGGDVIWAGMCLFFLRMIFLTIRLWKLALINYALGVADEFSQLYQAPWANAVRANRIGRLLFGVGFLWSDILCYAIGTLLAFIMIRLAEKKYPLHPAGIRSRRRRKEVLP